MLAATAYGFHGDLICPAGQPQCFKLGWLSLFPFQMHATHTKATALQLACNVVWLPAGITVAFCHGVFGLLNAMSVVGLPFAYTHLRLAQYALWPFGTTFDMNLPLRASKGVE